MMKSHATISRRAALGALASLPAMAGATALPVAMAALSLQERADNVWKAAEALKQAMTDLHGVPCKIGIGSDTDCIVVLTKVAVRP
ncbi:hypothetical protein [Mesorhizobium sp.]|uniref:hypothetical protein n=2 Tax=Mesorhizobium sp. TaxID=1871066 RepID=UPI000FE58893|nr:hypothetical protein [Mesorhizobium sp.]RWH32211.1 MAG: hypothetical protein EOQ76_03715 [Mesorhizobium sp.]RWH40837.1 MAG: hypothetical protein EOQ79_02660 [Mesorhizobium sp.]TIR61460.1 MAG: hypothetical protein E5X22_04680 [Mesorhizobium sp.]